MMGFTQCRVMVFFVYQSCRYALLDALMRTIQSTLLVTLPVPSMGSSISRISTIDSSMMPDYTELAAQVIPQTKTGLPIRLRSACAYLPMPLYMGWDTDSLTDTSDSTTIPHLKLTDMLSGATREIQASWMHALYKHTSSRHDGVTLLHLKEAGYSSQVSWPHIVIVATLTVQLGFALYGFFEGQEREGWIILLGVLTRFWEGLIAWAYPATRRPRIIRTPRFYALHTGMTTIHILVIAHGPAANNSTRVEYINLEDSAVPLPRNNTTSLESSCKVDRISALCCSSPREHRHGSVIQIHQRSSFIFSQHPVGDGTKHT
ncbi:hypothetical protein IW261DRAFT_131196 [Armillaria novae-zelandiae]|uniref:Uncharacterized protein n=1 Tax=Armillaria novae-zelandiae TaxID=153914 RepID=A0AA39PA12_9AGAR|nr:hypothetical protein IW261DRAFT_131196 [Armillaria novae-zelandiae]